MHFQVFFSILIEATFKEKKMLPLGSIFFPLIVAPLKRGFLYAEIYSTVQELFFDDTDTKTHVPRT